MLKITKVQVNNSTSIDLSDREQDEILGGGFGSGLMAAGAGVLVADQIVRHPSVPEPVKFGAAVALPSAAFVAGFVATPW
jgi:hypothetical protein